MRREVTACQVRAFAVSSQTEGCVADAERGLLYLGEENVGIWCFSEPENKQPGRLIARVGQQGLASNIEGLAIYYAAEGKGYLIASSQGSDANFTSLTAPVITSWSRSSTPSGMTNLTTSAIRSGIDVNELAQLEIGSRPGCSCPRRGRTASG